MAAMEAAAPADRDRAVREWRDRRLGDDLDAEAAALLAQVGHRWERFAGLRRIAREHLARGDVDAGEQAILRALVEARRGGAEVLEMALRECAPLWAAR
jgi:hypothetical protein